MVAGTTPIFTDTPRIGWGKITAADTGLDGTGANVKAIFTAGADGSYVYHMSVKSNTTSATSAAATLRIWINNGSAVGTAANNTLIREYTLTTVTASSTAATMNWQFPLNFMMPGAYVIYAAVATLAGSTGYDITVCGGDY